jgi:hypothetical protein
MLTNEKKKMSRKSLLKKSSKDKVKEYVKLGVLNPSQIMHLWDADDYESIIFAISKFLNIDEEKTLMIWNHIINHVWIGVFDDDDKATVFNEYENIFFRELLKNKGMLTRKFCLENVFKTSHINDKVTKNLIDMEIIDSFQLTNWQVIYVLNLNFYKEVFVNGRKEEE